MTTSAHLPHAATTVSGEPEHVARAVAIDRDLHQGEQEWIAALRADGVKAAHPDDGWVKRDENRVHLCYPQFNDNPAVGDLIALGSSYRGQARLVRVTRIEVRDKGVLSVLPMRWYHFEAA